MNATIQFTCPQCSHTMQLPTSTVGKQGKCPSCNAVVTITASQPAGPSANQVQVAPQQPSAAIISPQPVQRVQQQAPAAIASPTPEPAAKPRKSHWKLLCVTHILVVALTIGLMPYWKPHLEPFFPADYLAQNSTEATTPEPELAVADIERDPASLGEDDPPTDEMLMEGEGDFEAPGEEGESPQEAISSLEEVKRKDTSTPEKVLAAWFDARSIDERLLYAADRENDEAAIRESVKDKDWDNPTTFSFISMDEVSPNETKVFFSMHFPMIWEVMLKKEEGNFGFDYSTQKINLEVKIAELKEYPGVEAGIFFSNPRAYSNKLVRLDAVKLMSSVHDIYDSGEGPKIGSIFVRAKNGYQGLHDRTVHLDSIRFPKLEEGAVASFIATVKIMDGKPTISLVEMIDDSYEPAPVQVNVKRLKVFPTDFEGKTVRFSNAQYLEIDESNEENLRFTFFDDSTDLAHFNVAKKGQWAEFILSLEKYERINVEGVVVCDLDKKSAIRRQLFPGEGGSLPDFILQVTEIERVFDKKIPK